jgi:hypothetical protein
MGDGRRRRSSSMSQISLLEYMTYIHYMGQINLQGLVSLSISDMSLFPGYKVDINRCRVIEPLSEG